MRRLLAALLLVLLVASVAYAAIDTENKRRCTESTRRTRRAMPVPDAEVGNGDRAQLAFSYRGFLDEAAPVSTGSSTGGTIGNWCRHHRRFGR